MSSSINWFEKDLEYVGVGHAEFQDPKIILEGPVRIQFRESGESDIRMEFRTVKGEDDTGILEFLNRDVSVDEYRQILDFVMKIEKNQCTKFEVITPNGIFSNIDFNIRHYIPNHLRSELEFFILTSQFETQEKGAKYWVIPLYNFLTHFYKQSLETTHPLSVNDKDLRIIFKFDNNSCFIEPFDDYELIKNELINFSKSKRFTALMVGELKSTQVESKPLDKQVPEDFLELLGLAIGTEVGSQWIEFRTEERKLVKRVHVELNNPIYFKGHTAIDEFWDPGIATLLTNGKSLLHLGNSYMTATLKHLVRAGSRNLTMDEKLTHLFQALDCLCEIFNFKTQNLNQSLNTSQKNQIKDVLKKARQDIITISNAAINNEQSQVIRKIAERTSSNPASTTRDFGLCLSDLLKLFDLPDANILEKHYQTSKGGKSWLNYISHCRGVEIHKGFLDFYEGEFDPIEIGIIKAHLHDILLRLVFKMLYYDGIYRSPIGPLPNPKEINWVKSNTSPKELGY